MENSSFSIKTKNDYLKYGKRSDVHTSIREDIYCNFKIECMKLNQPTSKAFDVILKMIFEDDKLLSQFKNEIRKY